MKKSTLHAAMAVALTGGMFAATSVEAAVLSIDQGAQVTATTVILGTTYSSTTTTGSWFSMDASGNGAVEAGEITVIGGLNGIDTTVAQAASGSHGGEPGCTFDAAGCSVGYVPAVEDDPLTTDVDETAAAIPGVDFTEAPDIDNPWLFFSNTGMSFTATAVGDALSTDDAAGTATLDFSGWRVTWAGIPSINMGGDATNYDPALNTGIAAMSCTDAASGGGASTACADGAFYTLNYNATVPLGDASGFGGVPYVLHLEGQITGDVSAVPVPAAVWLFGSGLLGLVGVARRRKQA